MYPYPQQPKSYTGTTLVLALLLAAGFFTYDYVSPYAVDAQSSDIIVTDTSLKVLGRIESLKLDGTFFTDKTYLSLQDLSVDIVPQTAGRLNPFAPLSATPSTPVKTVPASKTTKTTAR